MNAEKDLKQRRAGRHLAKAETAARGGTGSAAKGREEAAKAKKAAGAAQGKAADSARKENAASPKKETAPVPEKKAAPAGKKGASTRKQAASAPAKKAAAGKGGAEGKKPGGRRSKRAGAANREARAIVRHSAVAAAVLVALLGVLALYRPQINLARASRYIARLELDKAETLIAQMVREEYPEADIADVRFQLAERYLGMDDYARVYALLEELPETDPRSADLSLRTRYREAEAMLDAGEIERAAQAFYQLGEYGDSASRYDDARCAIAIRTYLDGDLDTARHLFYDIDSPGAHVPAAARILSGGDEAEAARIAGMEVFSAAALEGDHQAYEALNAAQEETSGARIAAGYRHSVGLRYDGRVLAVGDNSKGQCDVGQWQDVIQIAAGAAHTVGLRLDGTVLAVGDDSYGQCDVSGWTDITAVAASAFGTIGLKSDGSVVATKYVSDKASQWHGATWVAGGSYSVGCLYGQGSMLSSHNAAQLDMTAILSRLSICGAVSAGIGPDGALVTSYYNPPDWKGLVQVAVTQTGLLGVTEDGRALNYLFRAASEQELSVEGKAVEACGSGTHALVLTEDGRVFAFGSNRYGQCDVSDWQL